jgi:hypothetical protein
VVIAVLATGCGPGRGDVLETYTSEPHGFRIQRPAGWHLVETDDGRSTWFLPSPVPAGQTPETWATEFVVVMTRTQAGPLPESEVRRLAMSLLPMHGVSGFERTLAGTETVVWYRFELTGSTRGAEWASLGLLVTGPQRMVYVVCASPLATWRERQKVCEEVIRSFAPGDLAR